MDSPESKDGRDGMDADCSSTLVSPVISHLKVHDLQSSFYRAGRTHQKLSTPASQRSATLVSAAKYVAPVKQELPHKGRVCTPRPPISVAPWSKAKAVSQPTTPRKTVVEEFMDEDDFSVDDLNFIDQHSQSSNA